MVAVPRNEKMSPKQVMFDSVHKYLLCFIPQGLGELHHLPVMFSPNEDTKYNDNKCPMP
jgi:hypothetical protein